MIMFSTSDFDATMKIINGLLPDKKLLGGVDTLDRRIIHVDAMAKTERLIRSRLTAANIRIITCNHQHAIV